MSKLVFYMLSNKQGIIKMLALGFEECSILVDITSSMFGLLLLVSYFISCFLVHCVVTESTNLFLFLV